jgi:hypothetical protein
MTESIEAMVLQVLTAMGDEDDEAAASKVIAWIAEKYGNVVQHVVLNEVRRLQSGS